MVNVTHVRDFPGLLLLMVGCKVLARVVPVPRKSLWSLVESAEKKNVNFRRKLTLASVQSLPSCRKMENAELISVHHNREFLTMENAHSVLTIQESRKTGKNAIQTNVLILRKFCKMVSVSSVQNFRGQMVWEGCACQIFVNMSSKICQMGRAAQNTPGPNVMAGVKPTHVMIGKKYWNMGCVDIAQKAREPKTIECRVDPIFANSLNKI